MRTSGPHRALSIAAALLVASVAGSALAADRQRVTQGTLTYHVDHRFKSFDAVMPASSAELWLSWDAARPEALTFEASIPLGSFDSGNQLRDEHAAEALELFLFPSARWVVESAEVVEREPAEGVPDRATLRVAGPLTLRDVASEVVTEVTLTRAGGMVRLQASFDLSLEAFGIQRPGLLGFKIDDRVTVTVDLLVPVEQGG